MFEGEVSVLRIGHRLVRDDRTTTHAVLVSRAFGGSKIFMTDVDEGIKETINRVNKSWGGFNQFSLEIVDNWKNLIKEWKKSNGKVVHLTMYGLRINDAMDEIKSLKQKILVIVGAEKVPKEIYYLSDYNISIGNQPHSEIAALAIFFDRLFEGRQFDREFGSREIEIIPSSQEKKVIRTKRSRAKAGNQ